jgi:hypothetical protein
VDPNLQNFLYSFFLTLHNLTRWLVIVFAVLALVRAFRGWLKKQDWSLADDRAGLWFTSMIDTQLLLGLILYFIFTPAATRLFANFGEGIRDPGTRFFGLEHLLMMIIATLIAHVARALSRRAKDQIARHRAAAIGYSVTILVILAAIPWPFMSIYGRPLFRLFGLSF